MHTLHLNNGSYGLPLWGYCIYMNYWEFFNSTNCFFFLFLFSVIIMDSLLFVWTPAYNLILYYLLLKLFKLFTGNSFVLVCLLHTSISCVCTSVWTSLLYGATGCPRLTVSSLPVQTLQSPISVVSLDPFWGKE